MAESNGLCQSLIAVIIAVIQGFRKYFTSIFVQFLVLKTGQKQTFVVFLHFAKNVIVYPFLVLKIIEMREAT